MDRLPVSKAPAELFGPLFAPKPMYSVPAVMIDTSPPVPPMPAVADARSGTRVGLVAELAAFSMYGPLALVPWMLPTKAMSSVPVSTDQTTPSVPIPSTSVDVHAHSSGVAVVSHSHQMSGAAAVLPKRARSSSGRKNP